MYYASRHFSSQVLNTFRGITAAGIPQLWIGLFINDPTASGTGIEVAYTGYERQPVEFTPPALFNGQISIMNTTDITWPVSDASTPDVTHVGIFDNNLTGNMLLRGSLTVPLQIRPQQQPSILQGDVIYWGRGDFTESFRTAYLNILRGITLQGFTPRLALFNNEPERGGAELSGENYSRPEAVFATPVQAENGVMVIRNTSPVIFPRPMGTWGLWTHHAVMRGDTAQAAGSLANEDPITILRNYNPRFAENAFGVWHS